LSSLPSPIRVAAFGYHDHWWWSSPVSWDWTQATFAGGNIGVVAMNLTLPDAAVGSRDSSFAWLSAYGGQAWLTRGAQHMHLALRWRPDCLPSGGSLSVSPPVGSSAALELELDWSTDCIVSVAPPFYEAIGNYRLKSSATGSQSFHNGIGFADYDQRRCHSRV
jgi:hypothetical protein